jgi:hypothetical protein
MDPGTGNILTAAEVEMLGLRMEDMIPLDGEMAIRLIAGRRQAAATLVDHQRMERAQEARRKRNKVRKRARKNNRH